MAEVKYVRVSLELDVYEALTRLAEEGYRTVPAEIRLLVDREMGNQELAAARAMVVAEPAECGEAK